MKFRPLTASTKHCVGLGNVNVPEGLTGDGNAPGKFESELFDSEGRGLGAVEERLLRFLLT